MVEEEWANKENKSCRLLVITSEIPVPFVLKCVPILYTL